MKRALTATEKQVAMLVAWGATGKQVAALLQLSAGDVEGHLARICQKLDVGSRAELSTYFRTSSTGTKERSHEVGHE